MRKIFKFLTLALAAAVLVAAPTAASAQGANLFGLQVQPFQAQPVGGNVVAADIDPAVIITYTGPGPLAKVANSSTASITFTVAGAAYTGFECPVSGALGGVIDVSNASCDTLGEVVDAINSDIYGYFHAVIAAGLRADSSAAFVTDAADTDVDTPEGERLYFDSSVLDDTEIVLNRQDLTQDQYALNFFGPATPNAQRKFPRHPYQGEDTVLLEADEKITNAGTIGNFVAYCVVEDYGVAGVGASEVATAMYTKAGAATTVLGSINEFLNAGGLRCRDGKVVVRIYASGADTSAFFLQGYGYRFKR